jgi:hypothetical protein
VTQLCAQSFRIGALINGVGCGNESTVCHTVGWHTKGYKCDTGAAMCTGYLVGAHRAAPHDPVLTATRIATSPFEATAKATAAGTA